MRLVSFARMKLKMGEINFDYVAYIGLQNLFMVGLIAYLKRDWQRCSLVCWTKLPEGFEFGCSADSFTDFDLLDYCLAFHQVKHLVLSYLSNSS